MDDDIDNITKLRKVLAKYNGLLDACSTDNTVYPLAPTHSSVCRLSINLKIEFLDTDGFAQWVDQQYQRNKDDAREALLREQYPTVHAAYEQYLILLKMCKE